MSRRETAEEAFKKVRRLERDVYGMVRATIVQPWRYARTVVEQDDEHADLDRFNRALRRVLSVEEFSRVAYLQKTSTTTYAEDIVQVARWQRNRTIYMVHPATTAALLDTDWESAVIPGEILTRLPHPDVMVVLPEPIRWRNSDGDWETYEMFGVFGVRPPRRRSSSHHPDISHIVLHYFGRITDEDGVAVKSPFPDLTSPGSVRNVTQVLGCRVVVDVQQDGTLREREEFATRDMFAGGPSSVTGFSNAEEAAEGMSLLTRTGLAILTYIASETLDIERHQPVRGKGRKGKARGGAGFPDGVDGEDVLWRVGYRIGAALSQYGDTGSRKSGVSTGRTVAPHMRRAHLHTFRRGPGRSERFVKWLPPIAVNRAGKRSSGSATVHEVTPPSHP